MRKFDARYIAELYLSNRKDAINITYPITCKFNCSIGTMSDSLSATFDFYNLAPSTREEIFQDLFTTDSSQWKYIYFYAGYVDGDLEAKMPLCFKGRIIQAYSAKQGGSADVITHIEAQALDVLGLTTSHTFASGTSYKEAYKNIASDMPNVTIGAIGSLEGTFQTPTTFHGNAYTEINKLTGGNTFIDNGVLNTLMNNECLDVPVPVISDSNALLGTPVRRDANLNVRMLFEPNLQLGQLIEIKSSIAPIYNGQYKLLSYTHDCLFSATQEGTRTTTVNLWIGALAPGSNISLTGNKTQNTFNKVKGEDLLEPVNGTVPQTARQVYDYIKSHNGQIPNTWATNHISWKNLLGNDNWDSERMFELTLGVCVNCYQTAQKFETMYNKYFKGYTVQINSGWRSVRNNKKWGGVADSRHLYGLALDFKFKQEPTSKTFEKVHSAWRYGYNYPESAYIHIQVDSRGGYANDK